MKKHIILLLKTLINNNACVEAARTREKKYNIIAPILAVFALFFCAMPVCIKYFQVAGSGVVSTSYGADDGLWSFSNKHEDFTMIIKEEADSKKHYLDVTLDNWNNAFKDEQAYDSTQKEAKYKRQTLEKLYRFTYESDVSGTNLNYLEIYFTGETGDGFTTFCSNIAKNLNPYNTNQQMSVQRDENGENPSNLSRSTSFIVFSKYQVYIAIYNPKTSAGTAVASRLGDYDHTAVNTNLMTKYYDKKSQNVTLDNWKVFLDECYINTRFTTAWTQTGINLAINGGVIILMGFVIWITTRGKNNPFRIYSYWDSQKICFYACFTPGLIGLLGFMSVQLSTMLFAMSCGIRVLWLSMRTLKYQAPAK